MRVRVVLAIALLLAVGGLALDMSGRAQRLAGTDHVSTPAFTTVFTAGQQMCQPDMVLPQDTATLRLLVGTFGPPVPALSVRFLDPGGRTVASGALAAGARQGTIAVPISRSSRAVAGTLCIVAAGHARIVFAGEPFAASPVSLRIDGRAEPGRIGVTYLRPGRESWWQLLPVIDERFGFGKASVFGDWTLPVIVLLLLAVWAGAGRLVLRELREPADAAEAAAAQDRSEPPVAPQPRGSA